MKRRRDDKELLELLRRKAERLHGVPTWKQVADDPALPHPITYTRRFGSWRSALARADVDAEREMLLGILRLTVELKHFPTKEQIDADERIPSYNTYRSHYGGLPGLKNVIVQTFFADRDDDERL